MTPGALTIEPKGMSADGTAMEYLVRAGISDDLWQRLRAIAAAGEAYCSPRTFADLRKALQGFDLWRGERLDRAATVAALGTVRLVVKPDWPDGQVGIEGATVPWEILG